MANKEKNEEFISSEDIGDLDELVEDQDGDTEEIEEEKVPEDYVERKLWEAERRKKN